MSTDVTWSLLARIAVAGALCLTFAGCAQRYSRDRDDWTGPHNRNFDADYSTCRERSDSAGMRIRGDSRLIFLTCMEERGWYPREGG